MESLTELDGQLQPATKKSGVEALEQVSHPVTGPGAAANPYFDSQVLDIAPIHQPTSPFPINGVQDKFEATIIEAKTTEIVGVRVVSQRTTELAEYRRVQDQCPVLTSTGCTREICQSGRMVHTDEPRIGENRDIASVKSDATAFLKEMVHAGIYTPEQYDKRLIVVLSEIEGSSRNAVVRQTLAVGLAGGNYEQTPQEIEFGIRRSWRNARKCIMRSHYDELIFKDLRGVKSSVGMVNSIIEGMIEAYNSGNIKPTVFVFPARSIDESGPMFLSQQVLAFAGYKQKDGSILGDPASVQLTQDIMDMGWKPPVPRTPWDILPLIAMAEGDAPAIAELPQVLRKVVKLRHPRYAAEFEKLDLRWGGYPALSRLGFDIGGVQYTASPFIGWFMDAEIGVRNLADSFRYNVLPKLIKALKLQPGIDLDFEDLDDLPESEKLALLSRAQTELNYAVTYSFQKAGVMISDSLTASAKWCKFDDEFKAKHGYRLPADPYWIAPPQGSIIPVWHRGGAPNYQPKPMICRHVEDPIKTWKRRQQKLLQVGKDAPQIRFVDRERQVTKAHNRTLSVLSIQSHLTMGLDAALLTTPVVSLDSDANDYVVSVNYCTSGTTATKLAKKLHTQLKTILEGNKKLRLTTDVEPLDTIHPEHLYGDRVFLLVISTTGTGNIPANGTAFYDMCKSIASADDGQSKGFRFSIFGNGDSRYTSSYNDAAVKFHGLLSAIGGVELGAGFFEADTALEPIPIKALNKWLEALRPKLLELADGNSPSVAPSAANRPITRRPVSTLLREPSAGLDDLVMQRLKLLCTEYLPATLVDIKPHRLPRSEGSMRITLDVGAASWKDLSCIQILPLNGADKVDDVLKLLRLDGDHWLDIGSVSTIVGLTWKRFFTEMVDLESKFTSLQWIKHLKFGSAKAFSADSLRECKAFDVLLRLKERGLLDRTISRDTARAIALSLPLLNTRTYSIASANAYFVSSKTKYGIGNNQLDIMVKMVAGGRFSDLLLTQGSIPMPLQVRVVGSACGRILREWNGQVPFVTISTGAGFGPVRGLLQRHIMRLRAQSSLFGARDTFSHNISVFVGLKPCDLPLIAEIVTEASMENAIDLLSIVPSNDERIRIHDKFEEPAIAADLKKKLLREQGMVFICCGPQQAKDIIEALDNVLEGNARDLMGARLLQEVF